MLEKCLSKRNEQKAEIAAAVRLYLECAKFSLSLLLSVLSSSENCSSSDALVKVFSWSRCDVPLQKK
jgi:hypothetical protein